MINSLFLFLCLPFCPFHLCYHFKEGWADIDADICAAPTNKKKKVKKRHALCGHFTTRTACKNNSFLMSNCYSRHTVLRVYPVAPLGPTGMFRLETALDLIIWKENCSLEWRMGAGWGLHSPLQSTLFFFVFVLAIQWGKTWSEWFTKSSWLRNVSIYFQF